MSLFKTWTGQSQRSQKSDQSNSNPIQHDAQSHPPSRPQPQRYPSRNELHPIASNRSNADPFAGHLNHLTEQQERQLERFKAILLEHSLYRAASPGKAASHDDQTLLRFLRARKFDIRGAFAQFSDTEKWSKQNKIKKLYEEFDIDFYERARKLYPEWTGRRDKRGIPVFVYMVKNLDSKAVNTLTKEAAEYKARLPYHSTLSTPAKMLPLFALYENLLRFTIPLCSSMEDREHPEVPVTNSNNIVDISGVGLKQFWNLKDHMQESSVLATAHYPETLDRIYIIGAPSFFPTVWSWIKRWFDPVTVNKIFILPQHEVKARLSEFIDPDNFPKKYGGNLDWEPGMVPDLDAITAAALEKNGTKEWIKGPCLWEQNQRIPVGTVNGKPRRPVRVEPIPVSAAAVEPITDATTVQQVPAPPLPTTTQAVQHHPAESTHAPSMTHSGSTASTFVNMPTPPDLSTTVAPSMETHPTTSATVPPNDLSTANSIHDSEASIVGNSTEYRADSDKPPMERFVTAAEDLHTTGRVQTQFNAVSA